jgi:hypothetical protein
MSHSRTWRILCVIIAGLLWAQVMGAESAVLAGEADGAVPGVAEVLKRHAATWAKLQRIEVEFDTEFRWVHDDNSVEERVTRGQLWRRFGKSELYRGEETHPQEGTLWRLAVEGVVRTITFPPSADASSPAPPPGIENLSCRIERNHYQRKPNWRHHGLETVNIPATEGFGTLAEFVKVYETRVTRSYEDGGDHKLALSARPHLQRGMDGEMSSSEFVVNLSKGGLLEYADYVLNFEADDGQRMGHRFAHRVQRWLQPEPGLWYPAEVVATLEPERPSPDVNGSIRSSTTVTKLRLDGPELRDEMLGFAFPENTPILDETDPKRPRTMVVEGGVIRPLPERPETTAERVLFWMTAILEILHETFATS